MIVVCPLMNKIGSVPEYSLDGLMGLFRYRLLSFNTDAARRYPELAVVARLAGKSFPTVDGYLAAIAASRGSSVATHDTTPYVAAGVTVSNPWVAR